MQQPLDDTRLTEEFIMFMLGCGVLKLGSFKAKSGRQTPYFLDAGRYGRGAQLARLGAFYASKPDGKFADLFTTRKSFATTPDVASIYELPPWSGEGEPPDIPDPERVGFLTRAALLATGSPSTRPIMKGVFVRTAFLCDELASPPANAMMVAQDTGAALDAVMSTRKRVEAITGRPDCACSAVPAT